MAHWPCMAQWLQPYALESRVQAALIGTRHVGLGSASPALLRQSCDSLAGRLEIIEVDAPPVVEGAWPAWRGANPHRAGSTFRRRNVMTL